MEKISLHILLNLLLLVLLGLGYYHFRGMPRQTGAWIAVFSFLVFPVCIYAGRLLCSAWFLQSRPLWYLVYFIPLLAAILVSWYVFIRIAFHLPNLGFTELSVSYGPFFILGFVTGFLIKLVRLYTQKQLNQARALAVQKENELHQLQSQLSPHFLFNTLNNMYGISIADHKRLPKLLLKLSDLLRYSLYETEQTFVPLKNELAYIRNYIEFERMRVSDRLVLNEQLEEPANSVRIIPMLLIVFVENAFKHSKNTLNEKIEIDISLNIRGGMVLFTISNTYNPDKGQAGLLNKQSGLGLANAKKRMQLLYGDDQQLKACVNDDKYTVELELKVM